MQMPPPQGVLEALSLSQDMAGMWARPLQAPASANTSFFFPAGLPEREETLFPPLSE